MDRRVVANCEPRSSLELSTWQIQGRNAARQEELRDLISRKGTTKSEANGDYPAKRYFARPCIPYSFKSTANTAPESVYWKYKSISSTFAHTQNRAHLVQKRLLPTLPTLGQRGRRHKQRRQEVLAPAPKLDARNVLCLVEKDFEVDGPVGAVASHS